MNDDGPDSDSDSDADARGGLTSPRSRVQAVRTGHGDAVLVSIEASSTPRLELRPHWAHSMRTAISTRATPAYPPGAVGGRISLESLDLHTLIRSRLDDERRGRTVARPNTLIRTAIPATPSRATLAIGRIPEAAALGSLRSHVRWQQEWHRERR
ncbi:hypothetical protein OH77DRAFT_833172 [Trametes cingulata]|nr:hypothetical protein OH77DRAFT_833172 [Trametes cingulata]